MNKQLKLMIPKNIPVHFPFLVWLAILYKLQQLLAQKTLCMKGHLAAFETYEKSTRLRNTEQNTEYHKHEERTSASLLRNENKQAL